MTKRVCEWPVCQNVLTGTVKRFCGASCRDKARYAANPEPVKARVKAFAEANPEKRKAYVKAHRAAHPVDPAKAKVYNQTYYAAHRERILAARKAQHDSRKQIAK